jgi:hypothetical protein
VIKDKARAEKTSCPCFDLDDGGLKMATSTLKGLTLGTMPAATVNPVVDRRNRIVARLEEQKALLANPNFKRKIKVRENGVMVDKEQRVLPWWRPAANGTVALAIRAGKLVEFAKGQTAVLAPSLDKLPQVIDALIAVVRSGELDGQLEAAGKGVGKRKAIKKAA